MKSSSKVLPSIQAQNDKRVKAAAACTLVSELYIAKGIEKQAQKIMGKVDGGSIRFDATSGFYQDDMNTKLAIIRDEYEGIFDYAGSIVLQFHKALDFDHLLQSKILTVKDGKFAKAANWGSPEKLTQEEADILAAWDGKGVAYTTRKASESQAIELYAPGTQVSCDSVPGMLQIVRVSKVLKGAQVKFSEYIVRHEQSGFEFPATHSTLKPAL